MEYLKKHPIYLFTNRERLSFLCVVNTIHINIIKSSLIYMCLYIHIYEGRVEEKNHFVDESEIGM